MLHANDKVSETEPFLRQILGIDPSDTDAKLGIILLKKKNINSNEYLVTLHPLINNADIPLDTKIKELLPFVQQHAAKGDTILGNQLAQLCDNLVILHPNEAKAHAIYADILKNQGNKNAAIRQYEKTLSSNKKIFLVWEQLMYCLDDVENYSRLHEVATEAMDYFPNQAISYYFSAKALVITEDTKNIISVLDEAILISAGNPTIESIGEIERLKPQVSAIVVDMHAEATSENMAMGHYLDGLVTVVAGTHTHVQTADEQILPKGTAYITDIGMTGPLHSVIGIKKVLAIEKFLTGMPRRFEVASGPTVFCALLVDLDATLGKAVSVERIRVMD